MCRKAAMLFSLLTGALAAQISAPSLGLVYDAHNQALRRISGMPGAATLSDPVLSGIVSAAIAPDHSFAIVNDGEYKVYTAAGLRTLPTGLTDASRIAFSATGETAAFYAEGMFTLLTGLPEKPVLQTIAVAGRVGRFAVNTQGLLTISVAQEKGEGIFTISARSPLIHVLDVTQTSSIVFSKDGMKAWIADVAENRIFSLEGNDALQIATADDGVDNPLALAPSPDAQQLFIVNGGTASVVAFDLTRRTAVSSTPYACNPSALSPLAASSVFALTDLSSGPMWIFDASQPVMQTMFIPAVPAVMQ